MLKKFTLEYWKDGSWYVGRLRETDGVFSQGETLTELESNIKEAFSLMLQEGQINQHPILEKELELEIWSVRN